MHRQYQISKKAQITHALLSDLPSLSTALHADIKALEGKSALTIAEHERLRGAKGLSILLDKHGPDPMRQFIDWALHEKNGFLPQSQSTKPMQAGFQEPLSSYAQEIEDQQRGGPQFTRRAFEKAMIFSAMGGAILGELGANLRNHEMKDKDRPIDKVLREVVMILGGATIGAASGATGYALCNAQDERRVTEQDVDRLALCMSNWLENYYRVRVARPAPGL